MNIDLRALRIVPRNTNPDLGLLEITDDQGENPRIQAGLGTASFGQIQIHTGPTASPRSSFLGATSVASPTLIADSQNGARGQIQIDSDTGSPLVILPAIGMTSAVAWQLPGTNAPGALTNDGAGNMSWTAYVDLTSAQTVGGNKTWTGTTVFQAPVTIQDNAFMRTLTIDNPAGQEQIDVLSNSAIHEVRIRSNRNTTGDAIIITSGTSTTARVSLGTVNTGADGALSLGGAIDVAARGGAAGLVGVYVGGQRVVQQRQTDPGASPTTEQLRQILLNHGLIG